MGNDDDDSATVSLDSGLVADPLIRRTSPFKIWLVFTISRFNSHCMADYTAPTYLGNNEALWPRTTS